MSGRRLARLAAAVGAVAAAAALACTDYPTDGGAPVALSFTALPAPSVAAGDSLRDSTGAAVQLDAAVLDARGNPLDVSTVVFRSSDRALFTITPERYVIAGAPYLIVRETVPGSFDTVRVDSALVLAAAGGVQRTLPLVVTRAPVRLARTGPARDTIVLTPVTAIVDSAAPLAVRLTAVGDSAVYRYLVSFRVVVDGDTAEQTETSPYTLRTGTGGNAPLSALDTTDAEGNASRVLRVDRRFLPCPADRRPGEITVVAIARPRPDSVLTAEMVVQVDTAGFGGATGCGP